MSAYVDIDAKSNRGPRQRLRSSFGSFGRSAVRVPPLLAAVAPNREGGVLASQVMRLSAAVAPKVRRLQKSTVIADSNVRASDSGADALIASISALRQEVESSAAAVGLAPIVPCLLPLEDEEDRSGLDPGLYSNSVLSPASGPHLEGAAASVFRSSPAPPTPAMLLQAAYARPMNDGEGAFALPTTSHFERGQASNPSEAPMERDFRE